LCYRVDFQHVVYRVQTSNQHSLSSVVDVDELYIVQIANQLNVVDRVAIDEHDHVQTANLMMIDEYRYLSMMVVVDLLNDLHRNSL
jgi:hypothetical protein